MQISNNFSVSGLEATRSTGLANASKPEGDATAASGIQAPTDQLELSPEALAVSGSGEVSNQGAGESFRADRVAQLRQAIAEGNYDTDERMTEALSRMFDKLV